MGTTIRPELSAKNKYWLDKHRHYELKHFCLQYPLWKKAYSELDGYSKRPTELAALYPSTTVSDPTAICVEKQIFYADRMAMLTQTAKETDLGLWDYIFAAVTEGLSYDALKARLEIPCCRDVYFRLYRRFFWLLSQARQ